jgi:predicted MFS family arabinose efflux permease
MAVAGYRKLQCQPVSRMKLPAPPPVPMAMTMTGRAAALVFCGFAFAYFFSALLRAITATLAPIFSAEMGLRAADLGLLAGAYFFGFAALQLPLGNALDRFGPRRVLLSLLVLAVLGCAAFAMATSLAELIAARAMIGAGVGACLMAPLTCYRRHFSPAAQLRANSWMLMAGSLGMLASTLPVQWLLPLIGWRGLFWAAAAMLMVSMVLILRVVPADPVFTPSPAHAQGGYRAIFRHPLFVRLAPLGFFLYGGLVAVQALWAGPWLTRVAGWTASSAATGLFFINLGMLFTFMAWGSVMPRLIRRGLGAERLMVWGLPLSLVALALIVLVGSGAGAAHWALWCMLSTFVSLSQPAVGQAFPAAQAGRALSAFNLVIFSGVFCVQWGIGLLVDALKGWGWGEALAFQTAFGVFWGCCVGAYAWFLLAPRGAADNAD